jgi:hypothetical protein
MTNIGRMNTFLLYVGIFLEGRYIKLSSLEIRCKSYQGNVL